MPTARLEKPQRHFLPAGFVLTDWKGLESYFEDLVTRPLDTREQLEQWLQDMSELEAVVSEDSCWRQIKMTCDTERRTKNWKKPSIISVSRYSRRYSPMQTG
jgi:oligoendopeptidase F